MRFVRAEIRLADAIDEGQESGAVATRESGTEIRDHVRSPDVVTPATYEELGLTRQRVSEFRQLRDAGEEAVEQAIQEQVDEGRAPTCRYPRLEQKPIFPNQIWRNSMAKRTAEPKHWIPVSSADGLRHGEYEVSDGEVTVRYQGRHKSGRASSTGVPVSLGAKADEALAQLILSELAG